MDEKKRIDLTAADEKLQALCQEVHECDSEEEEIKMMTTLKLKKLAKRSKAAWEKILDEGKARGLVPKEGTQGEWGMELEKNGLTERYMAIRYERRDILKTIMKLMNEKLPKEIPPHVKEQMAKQMKEAIETGKPPSGMMLDMDTLTGGFINAEDGEVTPLSPVALSPTRSKQEIH